MLRFWGNGWISSLYIEPKYFFSFYGFEWIKPLGVYTYAIFFVCALSSLLVALGLFYRMASILLFLSFTYIEFMDASTYLNHYYFISLICFLLIFLPAHFAYAFDAKRNPQWTYKYIPQWNLDALKLMMAILYFYAGLAKLNSDWLLHAMPLKIWLPARNDMPILGSLFSNSITPFVFSWAGCLYDLSIPFLLWQTRMRAYAYGAVVVFHVLTALLFPIGMFPHIMMVAALIFFSPKFHETLIHKFAKFMALISTKFKGNYHRKANSCNSFQANISSRETAASFGLNQSAASTKSVQAYLAPSYVKWVFIVFFAAQILLPFRYIFYPGELFWTEEGYRFSWRVMLMEKAGYAQFTIRDNWGKMHVVNNTEFLTSLQEKMMCTQADLLLQYAHILRNHYAKLGFDKPQVYVDSYVALNGRLGKPLVGSETNLAEIADSFAPKTWIIPFTDDIKGF